MEFVEKSVVEAFGKEGRTKLGGSLFVDDVQVVVESSNVMDACWEVSVRISLCGGRGEAMTEKKRGNVVYIPCQFISQKSPCGFLDFLINILWYS